MIIIKCDKCKKELIFNANKIDINNDHKYDLCDDCIKELDKYINKWEENDE